MPPTTATEPRAGKAESDLVLIKLQRKQKTFNSFMNVLKYSQIYIKWKTVPYPKHQSVLIKAIYDIKALITGYQQADFFHSGGYKANALTR
jgi:hypothetical protein